MNLKMETIHSLESEQTVLGCFFLDCKTHEKIDMLQPESFYFESNRIIFQAITYLYKKLVPIDLISVSNILRENDFLDAIGGVSYLASLSTIVPTTESFDYYVSVLEKYKINRSVAIKAKQLASLAEQSEDKTTLLSEIRKIESELSMANINDFIVDIENTTVSDINEAAKVPSGFIQLDQALKGGYLIPSLDVVTGRRGVGKSTFLNQLIAEAMAQGKKVFMFSGELSPENILYWITQCVVNQNQLMKVEKKEDNTRYYKANKYAVKEIKEWLQGKLFIYDTRRGNDINLLISYMRVLNHKGVNVFILDNLMKLTDLSVKDNENLMQTNIVSALKDFADKTNSIVHLVAHAKKTFNLNVAPTEDDISGSGNITNLADYVTCIHRLYDEDRQHDAEIYLYKNRPAGKELRYPKQVRLLFSEDRKRYYVSSKELDRDFGYNKNPKFAQVEMEETDPF